MPPRTSRALGLLTAALLVLGVGVTENMPTPDVPVRSVTEQAQVDAEHRYRELAVEVRLVALARPDLADKLSAMTADLDAHADAVALPQVLGTEVTDDAEDVTASEGPTTEGPATDIGSVPDATPSPATLLDSLDASALDSLRDATHADPGPARVLASAGANQWRHAVILAEALGTPSSLPSPQSLTREDLTPGTPADPVEGDTPGADCSQGPLGDDADRTALRTVRDSEDRARYGYEIAASLLPDPGPALGWSRTAAAAVASATGRLLELCDPPAALAAGYAVGPALREDPAAVRRALEQEHAELYANLIGSAGDAVGPELVLAFNGAVQNSVAAGAGLETFPGLGAAGVDAASDPAVDPAVDPAGPEASDDR